MSQIVSTPHIHVPHALGSVKDDWAAVEVWFEHLRLRPLSATTIKSYRNEIAKLKWYCENIVSPVPSLWSVQDAVKFISWLQDEAGNFVSSRSIQPCDKQWTPFKTKPSKSSLSVTVRVVRGLFSFWVDTGYIARNPLAGLGRNNRSTKRKIKSIPPEFIDAVIKHMETSAGTDTRKFLEMVRNRFVIQLLERTGLRANEAVMADMDDIESIVDPKTQHVYWRLNVRHTKGGKESSVLLDSVVLEALNIYREAFGYKPTSLGREPNVALILSLRTQPLETRHGSIRYKAKTMREFRAWSPIRRRQTLWDIVKKSFEAAAAAMRERGYNAQADSLLEASTHWLRHTFGTRLVQEGHDLRLVAQMMRHSDMSTTMLYTEQDFLDVARQMQTNGGNDEKPNSQT